MADGEIILYQSDDGTAEIQLRAEGGTVWLAQADIADLFQTTPQNVTQHIKSLYDEGELLEAATCKELLQVRLEGSRDVKRAIKLYNLDVILGVGYRAGFSGSSSLIKSPCTAAVISKKYRSPTERTRRPPTPSARI